MLLQHAANPNQLPPYRSHTTQLSSNLQRVDLSRDLLFFKGTCKHTCTCTFSKTSKVSYVFLLCKYATEATPALTIADLITVEDVYGQT